MPPEPQLRPPRLLIASSSEGLLYARSLRDAVRPDIEAEVWDEGLFKPGEYTLESLLEHGREFDGALVLATADDRVISRGASSRAPRDNLLLEYGLFIAIFGRHRSLLLVEAEKTFKTPTDVAGLTSIPFRRTANPRKGLKRAAQIVRMQAARWSAVSDLEVEQRSRIESLLTLFMSEVRSRTSIKTDFGLHVFIVDRRYEPPQLVRVARERLTPKALRRRLFARGEGIVGTCWEREIPVLADFTAAPFASMTKKKWSALRKRERLGMDWELLVESRERYKAVGAIPITGFRPGAGFAGCIAYNLGLDSESDVVALKGADVARVLGLCAEGMAVVLGQS